MDRICGHGREVGTQHSTAGCYYKTVEVTLKNEQGTTKVVKDAG